MHWRAWRRLLTHCLSQVTLSTAVSVKAGVSVLVILVTLIGCDTGAPLLRQGTNLTVGGECPEVTWSHCGLASLGASPLTKQKVNPQSTSCAASSVRISSVCAKLTCTNWALGVAPFSSSLSMARNEPTASGLLGFLQGCKLGSEVRGLFFRTTLVHRCSAGLVGSQDVYAQEA